MLVSGYSGVGKTSVVNEVHKPIIRQRGYFTSGKFDQFKKNIPYAAIIQAFQELMRQLLTESPQKIDRWKQKLQTALGQQGKIIIDAIPEVELIIGEQPDVPSLPPTETQNRFNSTFQAFVQVLAQKEHPLVIFLDDLQWADLASLKLIERLMGEQTCQYLLLIGAYRDNEVDATHPTIQTIEKIAQAGAVINNIVLQPLDGDRVKELVADTVEACENTKLVELSELLFNKTQGNPFFLTQLLSTLHQEKLLTFDFDAGMWRWQIEEIQAIAIADLTIVELVARNIQKLPESTQQVLKIAACIGNRFNLDVLSIAFEKFQSDTAADLWEALQTGLVLPLNEAYKIPLVGSDNHSQLPITQISYKFLHDRVQQAAYSLIPDDEKKATHLKIGKELLRNTPKSTLEENIFDIVNQLNIGVEFISKASEKDELANLNLMAGKKAKAATAYDAADRYLCVGLQLLAEQSWQTHYNLTYNLHIEALEAAYLTANFERADRLSDLLLYHAQNLLEKVKIYELKIPYFCQQNQMQAALNAGLEVLKMLGEFLPKTPSKLSLIMELIQTKLSLGSKQIEDLVSLPEMTDPYKLAAMRVLMNMVPPAYMVSPLMFPSIVLKLVNLCIKYGNSPLSALAYANYAQLLAGVLGDIDSGYQFGQLALKLLGKFPAREIKAKIYFTVGIFVNIWKIPMKDTLEYLMEAYKIGVETGDIEFACYAIVHYYFNLFFAGVKDKDLENLAIAQTSSINVATKYQQDVIGDQAKLLNQLILNLSGQSENPCRLIGKSCNEDELLPVLKTAKNNTAISLVYIFKIILYYLFRELDKAVETGSLTEPYKVGLSGLVYESLYNFYYSLALLARYSNTSTTERKQYLKKVASHQKQMQKWALHAACNFQHKYELVEAETARVLEQNAKAMNYYDRAISGAQENGYIQEEALANELAAEFYLSLGKEKIAKTYMTDAYYGYIRWGAIAKVRDLEERYPQLLQQIKQRETIGIDRTLVGDFTSATTHSNSSSSGVSGRLDLASTMKASAAIASEIVLENLLNKLMSIVMENAGAQTSFLILEKNGQLVIEATATAAGAIALNRHDEITSEILPVSIINYVTRTKENVVLNNASRQGIFTADNYIIQNQIKSILCTPILKGGNLIGILYLENNLTIGAFTADRIELLKIISSQAAISLENALLYANLEQKVAERTLELNEKNLRLTDEVQERQRIEEALRFSEERFRAIFESTDDRIGVWDKNYNCLYANKAWLDSMGKPRGQVIGENFREIIKDSPEAISLWISRFETVFNTSKSLRFEDVAIYGERTEYSESTVSPIKDSTGNVFAVAAIYRDISDRKQTEKALLKTEQRYRAIVEDQTELICRFLPDGTLTFVNDAYCRYFNQQREELIGRSLMPVIPPEDAEKIAQFIASLNAENPIGTIEHRVFFGKLERWHQWTDRAIFDDQGNFIEFQAVGRDITDRKLAEEALQQSEAALRRQTEQLEITLRDLKQTQSQLIQTEKMSSLGQLVAGIAHEINNPVSFIYGNITHANDYIQDLLRLIRLYQQTYPNPTLKIQDTIEDISLDYLVEDVEKILGSMKNGADRIRSIVESLRNFSRLDESEMKQVDIHSGIESALLILDNRLQAKPGIRAINIVKEFGNLPEVECYPGQLNQVFMNILTNAIDALEKSRINDEGDSNDLLPITYYPVPITHYPFPTIRIRTELLWGNRVAIRIADNGSGMTEEVRQKLFDPFFTTKPVGKGTGLGLSVCYQIVVEKHGGQLTCLSSPGKGAELIIEIAIARSANKAIIQ